MAKFIASSVYNINDISDEVLCHIISFLPFKDAVRTSILSRRWRYLFTLLSKLDLKMDIDDEDERKCFIKFLDRLVFYRDMPSILSFHFQCRRYTNPQHVSLWICGLEWHNIQELDLWFNTKISKGSGLQQSLFVCENLLVLKLNSRPEIPARICFLHVKVLHFHAIVFPNDGVEERLFSSCLVLEDLVLYGCVFGRSCVKFSVSNQNLKRLTLEHIGSIEEKAVDILINAPNLIFLSYSISKHYSLKLVDVKSPNAAIIDFESVWPCGYEYDTLLLGASRQIQNIQTLKINYSVLRVLQQNKVRIPWLNKLTCLKIWGWEFLFDTICLEYFLARCVVLETLVFEEPRVQSAIQDNSIEYSLREDSGLGPLLCHLKTVEIKLFDIVQAEAFMALAGFILENGEVMEEMKIYRKQGSLKQRTKMVFKLGGFSRASSRCRLFFYTL